MNEPINLGRFRKAKAREQAAAQAAEKRVKFGRTKAERAAQKAQAEAEQRRLEGHLRRGEGEPGAD